jgi:hypothetical protein
MSNLARGGNSYTRSEKRSRFESSDLKDKPKYIEGDENVKDFDESNTNTSRIMSERFNHGIIYPYTYRSYEYFQ